MDRTASGTSVSAFVLSPRERGWTACRSSITAHSLRYPRASGDGPGARAAGAQYESLSPRERGWTAIIDARLIAAARYPRASGDGPYRGREETEQDKSYPRASGDGPLTCEINARA